MCGSYLLLLRRILRLEGLDLPLALGTELFQLLLLFQVQHWLFVGILGGLMPAIHLLRIKPSFKAVGTEFSDVQLSGLEGHLELVDSTPTIRVFLRCRHHLSLQPPGLPQVVEGDDVNAQLC